MHNTRWKVAEPHRENKAFRISKSRCFTVKKMLEKIMAENCAELMEANNSQNQDSKQIPSERIKNKFFTRIYHKL